ncbi:MAG: hypothetical protein IPP83_15750 [Flavobacteriales bacterium]|nr:hypothetical protein [Flavobacteriales bacterium]
MEDEREDLPYFPENYTPAALEILDLVKELAALQKRVGLPAEEMTTEQAEYARIVAQVHKCAGTRLFHEQDEDNLKGHEFLARLRAKCETCGEERDVHIIGDAYHKEADVTNDLLSCTVCKAEFVSTVPITHADKLKWLEFLLVQLTTVHDDGLTLGDRVPDQVALASLVDRIAEHRRTEAEHATKQRTHELAMQKVEEQLEVMRDTLLLRKLQLSGFSSGAGLA